MEVYNSFVITLYNYTGTFLKAIDEFMALRFTATGALPAAKRTQILLMTQHA
jgi:hypothetical protein